MRTKLYIYRKKGQKGKGPGIVWFHGGGYAAGMARMAEFTRPKELVEKLGAVVVSPEYRLSVLHPYPAALEDGTAAVLYAKEHAEELGIRSDQIFLGGESAGGGLCAAVCMLCRDRQSVNIAAQFPLYPMLSHRDTETSADNHGRVWNTKKNRSAWKMYLRNVSGEVPVYASPSLCKDYSGLPPCYTFVSEGEPFYAETLQYVKDLQDAGIEAYADIYPGNVHAFDIMMPWTSQAKKARTRFLEAFARAVSTYHAQNK